MGGELGEGGRGIGGGHGGVLAGGAALDQRAGPPQHAGPRLRGRHVEHDPYASLRFPEYRAFLAGMAAVFVFRGLIQQCQMTGTFWQQLANLFANVAFPWQQRSGFGRRP